MAEKFLGPAMSRLRVNTSPVARSSAALAIPASRSFLGLNFAGAPSTAKVQIRWKAILMDTVQTLGGTEPNYVCEERMDDMFQVRVSFRLLLDMSGTKFTDITVTGIECPTLLEAESEASVVALQELQDGCLGMCIVDVSRVRCRELEKTCYDVLMKATAVYNRAKSLFADWEENMQKAEGCYSAARHTAVHYMCPGVHSTYDLISDTANKLYDINSAYYQKAKKLSAKTEEVKTFIDHVRDRVEYFFVEPPLHQDNENRGRLAPEIKLRMKLVLWELMTAIGWQWPDLNVSSSGMSTYVCETSLFPNHVHIGPPPKKLTISGSEEESEEEAIESSCKAAIALLEREKSICLVDLNFNHRSHGELYVVEAREVAQSASFMVSQVLGEWEAMVSEIQACKEYCQNLPVDQSSQGANLMNRMKHSSTKAVAELHEAFLADLQLAKNRVSIEGEWIRE